MSILFLAGLPRSSSLGVADLLYRSISVQEGPVVMTGHLHLAAALSEQNLAQYDSPLHLYYAKEALIRSLLFLHGMPVLLETYESIVHYYFSSLDSTLNLNRFGSVLKNHKPLFIDPSFSHSMDANLIRNVPDLGIEYNLIILWRNPVDFCRDLMRGVYGFDCCLQWILSNSQLSFPLDPLMLWLEFVRPYLEILREPPTVIKQVLHAPRESLSVDTLSHWCRSLAAEYRPELRSSLIANMATLLGECPYSGDPSCFIDEFGQQHLEIFVDSVSRFSNSDQVIEEVVQVAQMIGYSVNR